MLTKLTAGKRDTLTGVLYKSVEFDMETSDYIIRKIDGLEPVKSSITTLSAPIDPGDQILRAEDVSRNIVIHFGFKPNYSLGHDVTKLRRELYDLFMPSSQVELVFTDSVLGDVHISGTVETHESEMFSEDPLTQVSILCEYPYFKKVADPIEVNYPSGTQDFTIHYPGTAPTGFWLEAGVTTSIGHYHIARRGGTKTQAQRAYFIINATSVELEKVLISSVRGDRYAKAVFTDLTVRNMLGRFSGSLVEMKLHPGPNHFRNLALGQTTSTKIIYDIYYGGL